MTSTAAARDARDGRDRGGDIERLFREEGVLELASGNRPFLLDDHKSVWFVEAGKVEIFAVGVEAGEPIGARSHFVSVDAGQVMFGMDLARYDLGSGFLAVGKMGTRLRRLRVSRLRELAADDRYVPGIAALLDGWVEALSRNLTSQFVPGPLVDVNLEPDDDVTLGSQQKARSARGVLWLQVRGGNLLFIGMEALVFAEEESPTVADHHTMMLRMEEILLAAEKEEAGVLFPLSVDTWVEAANANPEVETSLRARASAAAVDQRALWRGLDVFHEVLCQCEFINKKLAVVDEFNRLKSKADYARAARRAAYEDIASVLARPTERAPELPETETGDALFLACQMVGEASGIRVKHHPEGREDLSFEDRLAAIAKASRFRTRRVALRDDWFRHDQGPLLAQWEGRSDPVALLPTGRRGYQCVDPRTGARARVTAQLSQELSPLGFVFYPPFPEGELGVWDLVRHGARALLSDAGTLAAMGLSVGLLGALTPYFTGKIFDAAIPQADRGLLHQFAFALAVAAFCATAFRITQSIAVLRLQGQMDYRVQSALWDRLLNLPSRFFREWSAGDLADRAGGINAIRDLLAGAGIGAVLGSLSSLFFVVVMFLYSTYLAVLAMALTLVFVAFTSTANYLQLRYQRDQLHLRGRITGLVLQLVSGIAKVRVSGAEDHAFRTWVREFA
jgi:ATP-binding cassette subfamily C protein